MYRMAKSTQMLLDESKEKPVFIFKHSLESADSSEAKKKFDAFIESFRRKPYNFFLLIAQHEKELADEIQEAFGIKHESPQLIFLKDGKVHFHLNNQDITLEKITKALEKL